MDRIDTIDGVIEALGGQSAAAALIGAKYASAAGNWLLRGRIPPEHFFPISEALRKDNKVASPTLFGFEVDGVRA